MTLEETMKRTLVLYATRYGSTQEIAESIADRLGVKSENVERIDDIHKLEKYDVLILGAPIYGDDILEEMKQFIHSYYNVVGDKKLVLFSIYGAVKGKLDRDYSKKFASHFTKAPLLKVNLFGRATRQTMSEKDRIKFDIFYKNRLKANLSDFDYIGQNDIDGFCEKIENTLKEKC